ncbi:hypothetical protein [Acidisphaera rubrifaciens]|uniref:hypothetical protein n=1 Tax=Acidisphaera rubrifaciens TaxID=50715 RepID=UPI0011DCC059|nr:hypothetical protein [Acidisphaera rubrifaciens]
MPVRVVARVVMMMVARGGGLRGGGPEDQGREANAGQQGAAEVSHVDQAPESVVQRSPALDGI